ncbi:GatB/YqeY domain-containing protein [Tissierella sp. MSJ-40]|uniref:GatB/YqeY domain-containing protein n=1 Tax=Tissierella simiarum TaxID=2841534 RepID=A0ABS6E765_9FIRM|nr:GatB/YqeY domain-containing protein [Tissierella simiarum]MBU5438265.1 GatB/YqeY domain-containing protein [Tissierella simiarum]
MSLKEKLMEDLKDSMKSKDIIKKNTITMIRAAIKQKEVDERKEVLEEEILEIIAKQLKEKRTAIEDFKKGERQDLIDLTEKEIQILLEYLPKQLSEEEVEKIVIETVKEINATSIKDIGLVMKAVMPKVKGKTDGNMVNKVVRKVLS